MNLMIHLNLRGCLKAVNLGWDRPPGMRLLEAGWLRIDFLSFRDHPDANDSFVA